MADRMSPMDAYFVLAEADGVNAMHVGGFAEVEGKAPSLEEAISAFRAKLPSVSRRYGQVMRPAPLWLTRPEWVDAPDLDLTRHVRRTRLLSPGPASLRTFVSAVMSQQLDRTRPLWELWVIDGVGPDQWAFLWKVHHCMFDGVSGTEFLQAIFDVAPEPAEPTAETWRSDTWRSARAPGSLASVVDATSAVGNGVVAAAGATGAGLRHPRALADRASRISRDNARAVSRMVRSDRVRVLNGRVCKARLFDWVCVDLEDIQSVRRAFGGTVNHVVVTAAVAGYRNLLLRRGDQIDDLFLNSLIPVSLRQRDATGRPVGDGTMSTKATALIASLPLGIDDPLKLLRTVGAHLDELRQSDEGELLTALHGVSGLAPTFVVAGGLRAAALRPQTAVATVITNVQGPRETRYLMGRRVQSIYPYAPPFPVGARTSVSVYSYDGTVHFGITGDRRSVPDLDAIGAGIVQGITDLREAAARQSTL